MVWCDVHSENHHGRMRKCVCRIAQYDKRIGVSVRQKFIDALQKINIFGRRKKTWRG